MIGTGVIHHGIEVRRTLASRTWIVVDRVLRELAIETPVHLTILFEVGGSLGEPDFQGVRTGRYLRKSNAVDVGIAIQTAESDRPETPRLVVDRLEEALDLINAKMARAGVEMPKDSVALIESKRRMIEHEAPRTPPTQYWRRDPVTGERIDIDLDWEERVVRDYRDAVRGREDET